MIYKNGLTLYELIHKNPNGFTFDYARGEMSRYKTGFYVSLTDNPIDRKNLKSECDIFLKSFSYFRTITKREIFIGYWNGEQIHYLDFTIHTYDKDFCVTNGTIF